MGRQGKKTKVIPALKISPELHETICRLAHLSNRKLQDELRELLELGTQVEEVLLRRKEEAIESITEKGSTRSGISETD